MQPSSPPYRLTLAGAAALETPEGYDLLRRTVRDRYTRPTDSPRLDNHELFEIVRAGSEMVRWTVMRGFAVSFRGEHERNRAIIRDVLDAARAEGVSWTPLMDLLVEESFWPPRNRDSRTFYDENREDVASPESWLEETGLADYVAGVTDPLEIDRLLQFKAQPIWALIGANATVLTLDQIGRLLSSRGADVADALWNNPAVMDEGRAAVVRHYYQEYQSADSDVSPGWQGRMHQRLLEAAQQDLLPADVRESIVRYAGRYGIVKDWMGRTSGRREVARSPSHVLLGAVAPNTSEDELRTLAAAGDARVRRLVVCHSNATPTLWDEMIAEPDAQDWIADLAIRRSAQPSPALVGRLIEEEALKADLVAGLVLTGVMTLDMLRKVARERSEPEVRAALAALPSARGDEEIREQILESRSPRVAAAMIENAAPDEFTRLFKILARYEPDSAAEALAAAPEGVAMEPEDLKPLLGSEDSSVRLAAIQYLGELRDSSDEQVAKPKRRRRGSR